MTKLTEDIIRQRLRNCSSPLDLIAKINITGRDLEDISLLRKMTGVEVLSLSVNKISTLYDLQFCTNLKELYLRKNNITNLNEIYYIRDLQFLTVLGLSQNPCSNDINYRMTVIKNLPKLEKLDDVPVVPEERVEAFRKGKKIHHPREFVTESEESLDKTPSKVKFIDEKSNCDAPSKYLNSYVKAEQSEEIDTVCSLTKPNSRIQSPVSKMRTPTSPCRHKEPILPETHQDGGITNERPKMMIGGINHSNTLAGILVLVKDLDYPSLELLCLNVKNRLNEYHTNGYY